MNRFYFALFFSIITVLAACNQTNKKAKTVVENENINALIDNLNNSENIEIMVIAHRGDWRNAPENSLQAISNCIRMGIDMVEIDIQETKDGQLVLMHDKTLNRTTTGEGEVKDWTLDSLMTLNLVDGLGVTTAHRIPTLEEALLITKGKILVNLDKSYKIFDKCFDIIKKTETLDQVIIKGIKTRQEVEKEFGKYLSEVYFMPVIKLPNPDCKSIVDDYLENQIPVAFEFIAPQDTLQIIEYFDDIRAKGASIWVNALWAHHNGGHDDEKAVLDPSIYDWYIENNVDMIQTDRPEVLLNYLRQKGLHK